MLLPSKFPTVNQILVNNRKIIRCCTTKKDNNTENSVVGPFFRPAVLVSYKRKSLCSQCSGTKSVDCHDCDGKGMLPIGGYHQRNPVPPASRIVGSKWTAMEKTFGWRHFVVVQRRKEKTGEAYVLLSATCNKETQLWVNIKNLKDRKSWAAGWLQKEDLKRLVNEETLVGRTACKVCSGTGLVVCPLCSLAGEIIEL